MQGTLADALAFLVFASLNIHLAESFLRGVRHEPVLNVNNFAAIAEVEASYAEYLCEANHTMCDPAMVPVMPASDLVLIDKYLGQATHYQEFGAGGSTVAALAKPNIQRVHTVESAQAWVDILSKRSDIHQAIASQRLKLVYANIGPVYSWGRPVDTSAIGAWPAYSGLDAESDVMFDLVFVDGRFRVACFLKALNRIQEQNREHTVLMIHDYMNRPQYHVVEQFADKVEQAQTLVVFRKKAAIDTAAMTQLIQKYELDYA